MTINQIRDDILVKFWSRLSANSDLDRAIMADFFPSPGQTSQVPATSIMIAVMEAGLE